jgi:hypothetical protein
MRLLTHARCMAAVFLLCPLMLNGCGFVAIAEREAAEADEDDWGPFRLGMSLTKVKAIIKAKTGSEPIVEHVPGLNWDTIYFEDKMITIQNGRLLCVLPLHPEESPVRLADDEEFDSDCEVDVDEDLDEE